MRDAGVLPEWIEMEKQIRTRRQAWAERVEAYARDLAQVKAAPELPGRTSARAARQAERQREADVLRQDDARELFLLQAVCFLRLTHGRWQDVCRLETTDLRLLLERVRRKLAGASVAV